MRRRRSPLSAAFGAETCLTFYVQVVVLSCWVCTNVPLLHIAGILTLCTYSSLSEIADLPPDLYETLTQLCPYST
jgi:hypothetical protein